MQSQIQFPWIRFEGLFFLPSCSVHVWLVHQSPVSGSFPVQLMVS